MFSRHENSATSWQKIFSEKALRIGRQLREVQELQHLSSRGLNSKILKGALEQADSKSLSLASLKLENTEHAKVIARKYDQFISELKSLSLNLVACCHLLNSNLKLMPGSAVSNRWRKSLDSLQKLKKEDKQKMRKYFDRNRLLSNYSCGGVFELVVVFVVLCVLMWLANHIPKKNEWGEWSF